MNANEKILNTFATRVRQMILQYEELKRENDELYTLVDRREQEIKQLQRELDQAHVRMKSIIVRQPSSLLTQSILTPRFSKERRKIRILYIWPCLILHCGIRRRVCVMILPLLMIFSGNSLLK